MVGRRSTPPNTGRAQGVALQGDRSLLCVVGKRLGVARMRRLIVGLVALIAFGALGGYVAGAVTKPKPGDQVRGSLASIVVVRSDGQAAIDVATPVDVSSTKFLVTVPKGRQDLFDVRFSGVVAFPAGPTFPVAVDVAVDGIAMTPSSLPAWQGGAVSPIPFQVERAIGPLSAGTYEIGVQMTAINANDHRLVQLLGWTLVAQRTPESAAAPTNAI